MSYRYSYTTAVGRLESATHSKLTHTPAYTTDETQTSRHRLSFRKEDPEEDFQILPEADSIWKQARACFIAAEKAKIRSDRLTSWAKSRLTPAWAVGAGPTPTQFSCSSTVFNNRLGETLRMQACDTMFILAEGLKHEAQTKESQGQALYQSLGSIYSNNPEGLKSITNIITKYVRRDAHHTTMVLNKQEAELRAQPNTAADILTLRNPPPPPEETTSRRNSNKRSRQSRSRSPRQRPKRRRSNSRPRNQSRGRRQRGQNNNLREEDRLTNLFRQFLRLQKK